jgi:hypothetical protein
MFAFAIVLAFHSCDPIVLALRHFPDSSIARGASSFADAYLESIAFDKASDLDRFHKTRNDAEHRSGAWHALLEARNTKKGYLLRQLYFDALCKNLAYFNPDWIVKGRMPPPFPLEIWTGLAP